MTELSPAAAGTTGFTGEALARARKLRLLILDVDGVLSDGGLLFGNQGEELKRFNTLDGQGLRLLQRAGIQLAVITGRTSALVAKRCADLDIDWLVQGREDKYAALCELFAQKGVSFDACEMAHMGDDWPDLALFQRVGLALTVPNAHAEVRARAHWCASVPGGQGAVRQACDAILRAQGHYERLLAHYWADVSS
jgi:3-deoxy-D-manno-octulosonate 8-phosphate phosphatase (KDO 8-P phosphatase)